MAMLDAITVKNAKSMSTGDWRLRIVPKYNAIRLVNRCGCEQYRWRSVLTTDAFDRVEAHSMNESKDKKEQA